jgi:hypothetical protein
MRSEEQVDEKYNERQDLISRCASGSSFQIPHGDHNQRMSRSFCQRSRSALIVDLLQHMLQLYLLFIQLSQRSKHPVHLRIFTILFSYHLNMSIAIYKMQSRICRSLYISRDILGTLLAA